jgi:hypothetical protein
MARNLISGTNRNFDLLLRISGVAPGVALPFISSCCHSGGQHIHLRIRGRRVSSPLWKTFDLAFWLSACSIP